METQVENFKLYRLTDKATRIEKLNEYIQSGGDINACENKSGNKEQLIIQALKLEDNNCAELILNNGCDTNVKDVNNSTLLHIACYHNMPDIAKKLIDLGADINAIDYFEETPLLSLLSALNIKDKKAFELFKELIDSGTDVNWKTKDNTTAARCLIEYNDEEALNKLDYLLKHSNIDIEAKLEGDMTLLDILKDMWKERENSSYYIIDMISKIERKIIEQDINKISIQHQTLKI